MHSARQNKKGQGISMETIVIAVIVLFVLVILLLVFSGRISIFGTQLKSCSSQGGQCSANMCGTYGLAQLSQGSSKSLGCGDNANNVYYCCSKISDDGSAFMIPGK